MLSGITRPEGGGLSGEHIQLCAEGARLFAESLRQMDGDAYVHCAEQSFWAALFCLYEKRKEVIDYADQTY